MKLCCPLFCRLFSSGQTLEPEPQQEVRQAKKKKVVQSKAGSTEQEVRAAEKKKWNTPETDFREVVEELKASCARSWETLDRISNMLESAQKHIDEEMKTFEDIRRAADSLLR